MKDQSTGLFSLKGFSLTTKTGEVLKIEEFIIDSKIHVEMEDSEFTTAAKFTQAVVESIHQTCVNVIGTMVMHENNRRTHANEHELKLLQIKHEYAIQEMSHADTIEAKKHERIQASINRPTTR